MRSTWTILSVLAVTAFLCGQAVADVTSVAGTLWNQEGTTADGYADVDPRANGLPNGPTGTTADSWTNWKYQYGSGTYSGVYRADGWLDISETGDSKLDIECDIEMYYTSTTSNNKIYFHLGNPYTATQTDKTAIVSETFTANNGMYIGLSFDETSKTEADMLKDGGNYTGEVQNAMVGTKDVLGRDISAQKFNAKFLLQWSSDGGTNWSGFRPPDDFGEGASGTILNSLWWLVNSGQKGSYMLQYKVELLCPADQADGNYKLDPAIVAAPIL